MSASGSPSTATMSASLPASSVAEILVHLERACAALLVVVEDRVHRLHAEIDVDLQLAGVAAHSGLEAHVGAHRDVDAGLVDFWNVSKQFGCMLFIFFSTNFDVPISLRISIAWSVRCASVGVTQVPLLLYHADGLVVGNTMCSMVSAPALSAIRWACGVKQCTAADLVERVRLVHDRVELFLRHVADVGLFLVGAAAAGGAGLDHVAARAAGSCAPACAAPTARRRLEAEPHGGAWMDQRRDASRSCT